MKKSVEEKDQSISNINKETNNKITIESHLRKENEAQANDFSLMLKAANVEILELRKKFDEKEFEFKELKAAYEYKL